MADPVLSKKVEMKDFTKSSSCRSLLVAGLFLVWVPVHGAEPAKADYSGSLRASHDYRGLGEYNDSDAYAYWYLRGRNLADKRVDIYTSGRFHEDLDGSGNSYTNDPFISLEDTSLKDSVRVLQLYLDLQPEGAMQNHLVRIIADCFWRRQRLMAAETAYVNRQIDKIDPVIAHQIGTANASATS